MTGLINEIMSITDSYPILPPFFVLFCSLCAIPVVILMIVTRKCALHKNCRFLLTLWAFSLFAMLVDITLVSLYSLTYETGYLHRSLTEPFFRPYLLVGHSLFYTGGSCLEMFIALERILSVWRPHIYHSSGLNYGFLFIATYSLGYWAGYVLYIQSLLTHGMIIYNIIDLTTLTVWAVDDGLDKIDIQINAVGIRFCERRYKRLYAKTTLNARYQVKEAYLLAKAMHPVYLGSFMIKISAVFIAYTYIFLLDYFDGLIFAMIETIYFTVKINSRTVCSSVTQVHAFNCAFSSAYLMKMHKSLRRAARKLLRRKRKIKEKVSYISYNKEESSVTHFHMLDMSWK